MISRRLFLAGSAGLVAPAVGRAAAAPDGVVEVGPNRSIKSVAQAVRTPDARTVVVDPGVYRETIDIGMPVTLQAADWQAGRQPSVVIDARGLRLPQDKAAILCRADVVIRGFDVLGATGVNAVNGAGVRNDPGRNVTLEDCNLHHSQANLLVTSGEIVVRRTALHHNTGDGQEHNLYYASFRNVAPGTLLVEDSWIFHSANGNNLKSNARATNWSQFRRL